MAFSFYPAGGFSDPSYNKTVDCPPSGSDANCQGDKYEACILHTLCGGVSCKSSSDQLKLATFLHCFEGVHSGQLSDADGCASSAGLSVKTIRGCYDDDDSKAAAWAALQSAAAPTLPGIKCFPWIEVNGVVESKSYTKGCFGTDAAKTPLLPLICDAASDPKPAACAKGVEAS